MFDCVTNRFPSDPYSDCDVCMTQIAKIAGIYEDPPVLAHVEKRLLYASDGYCANPVIGLDEYEQLACQDWLKLFIPPGMDILLFSFLLLNPEGYLVFTAFRREKQLAKEHCSCCCSCWG